MNPVWWCPEHGAIAWWYLEDPAERISRHRRAADCTADVIDLVVERAELQSRLAAMTNTNIEMLIERNKLLERVIELEGAVAHTQQWGEEWQRLYNIEFDRRRELEGEEWVRDAPHHEGCSGAFGYPRKCGKRDLM